ncbi:glycosyltransferase family 4 protein [Lacipirellula sp.]|uniref:glycosyltransferase family 4 protein n=1 Tax=Lacipirellula sp. TaxID=2691419 RepID=UPI003D1392F1
MTPKLAIIANAPSPYRIHQHLRIAEEMAGEVELWSLFLHEHNWQPWSHALPEAIRPVVFGPGETVGRKTSLRAIANDWRRADKITGWLKEHQIDAVVTAGYHSPALARIIMWCRRHGVPNYLFGDSNVYGDGVTGWRRWVKQRYVGWVVRNVDGLLPCGEYGRRFFARYGGDQKPHFFMPHEPDYRRIFEVSADDRRRVEEKFNLPAGRRRIVYSGRLAPVKRVDTLIDAFARIAGQRPAWDLLVVGGGPLEAELKARVPSELQDRVAWTGFIDDPHELAALYRCGEAFVLPSNYEPWAVVVCEAAAAGLAIMASRVVGAAGELCRDGVNGRTFAPGNVDELAGALLEVTGDDELLATYRKASLRILDEWRRRGDPVQGVRLALAHAGLLPPPPPVEPEPPTPLEFAIASPTST